MISIIFCSIDPGKAQRTAHHYHMLCGTEPHEVIQINNPRSLADGYNRGIEASAGDIVIFSHDDIEFLEPATWLGRLRAHLDQFDLVGLAGTTRLTGPDWARAGPPYTFGQVAEPGGDIAPYRVLICAVPGPLISGMQALDGLFLAVRRRVLQQVQFDASTFDGFHVYDIDFSFSVHLAGFGVAVAADLPVLHQSQGSFDEKWRHYAQRFLQKHGARLATFPQRRYRHAMVAAQTREELIEILNGPRAQWPSRSG
jgi:GT2 family glycosyltransferase